MVILEIVRRSVLDERLGGGGGFLRAHMRSMWPLSNGGPGRLTARGELARRLRAAARAALVLERGARPHGRARLEA